MIENCLMEIQLEWKDRGLDLVKLLWVGGSKQRRNTQIIFKDYTLRGLQTFPCVAGDPSYNCI